MIPRRGDSRIARQVESGTVPLPGECVPHRRRGGPTNGTISGALASGCWHSCHCEPVRTLAWQSASPSGGL